MNSCLREPPYLYAYMRLSFRSNDMIVKKEQDGFQMYCYWFISSELCSSFEQRLP
jgi:hypothetical protein